MMLTDFLFQKTNKKIAAFRNLAVCSSVLLLLKCATQGTMPKERDDGSIKNGVIATRQTETVRRLSLARYQQIQICILQIEALTEIKISKSTLE